MLIGTALCISGFISLLVAAGHFFVAGDKSDGVSVILGIVMGAIAVLDIIAFVKWMG